VFTLDTENNPEPVGNSLPRGGSTKKNENFFFSL